MPSLTNVLTYFRHLSAFCLPSFRSVSRLRRMTSLLRSRDNVGRVLQDLAAVTGKPRFTRRSLSLRQHGRAGFAGAIRSRQASLELSTSPARSALLPEVHTPPPVPRKSNWEVIEHFSSSSGSLTRGSKPAQSANLIAVSSRLHQQVETLSRYSF
jgi:hypothetical protein